MTEKEQYWYIYDLLFNRDNIGESQLEILDDFCQYCETNVDLF